MSFHEADMLMVRSVQLRPSGEVAQTFPPAATAQKTEPFQATAIQFRLDGRAPAVHETPSGEVAQTVPGWR